MAANQQLVIVRHYEPPAPEEAARLARRVYDRLLDAALLERLTEATGEGTIIPSRNGGGKREGGAVRSG